MELLRTNAGHVVVLSGAVILMTLIGTGRAVGQPAPDVLPDPPIQIERPIQLQQMNIGDICRLERARTQHAHGNGDRHGAERHR